MLYCGKSYEHEKEVAFNWTKNVDAMYVPFLYTDSHDNGQCANCTVGK